MIIWGTRTRNVQMKEGQFRCPKCEEARAYKHMQQKTYFTLYFLPLFPVRKGAEWWECQTCTRAYEPRAEPLPPAAQQKHSF